MKTSRALGILVTFGFVPVLFDCSQSSTQATFRSLERSAKVALLCINDPTSSTPGRPLDFCHPLPTGSGAPSTSDYSIPHMIALVTQTARGEVAVIDTTARSVLDQNRGAPGYNFIPVGQIPTDIVSTPASSAAFVSVADPIRPGIFALPASRVLPGSFPGLPLLTSFPACALPAPPGSMVLLNDPLTTPGDPSSRRAHCPASLSSSAVGATSSAYPLVLENESYGTPKLVVSLPDRGELAIIDAQSLLDLEPGSFGPCPIERLVALSSRSAGDLSVGAGSGSAGDNAEGGSAVPVTADSGPLDGGAPSLEGSNGQPPIGSSALDGEAPDGADLDGGEIDGEAGRGAIDDAAIESGVRGDDAAIESVARGDDAAIGSGAAGVDAGGRTKESPTPLPSGAVCIARELAGHAKVAPGTPPRPSGLAYADDGRLFVSDENLPIIHVLSAADPCNMTEGEPLVATSAAQPDRTIVTTSIAVSPLTHTGKRFLYAVDLLDTGSLMVFDVSDSSPGRRTPLSLVNSAYSQSGEPDRIAFGAPVQALTFAQHDVPLVDPSYPNGVVSGVICNPNDPSTPYSAGAVASTTTTTSTSSTAPAGPSSLRGIFAFAALTNGSLRIIDVDDLDATCRRPNNSDDPRLGCSGPQSDRPSDPNALPLYQAASNEVSCRAVVEHQPRSAQYLLDYSGANRSPTMQTLPLLRNKDGTVYSVDPTVKGSESRPRLLGPLMVNTDGTTSAIKPYVTQVGSALGTEALSACPYAATRDRPAPLGCGLGDQVPAAANWVAFDVREPRVHRDEEWSITYEGTLPGFAAHLGQFTCSDPNKPLNECEYGSDQATYVFRDTAASFCNSGVYDQELGVVSGIGNGDLVQIIDQIPASDDAYWAGTQGACDYNRCLAVFGTPSNPAGGRERTISEAYQDRVVLGWNATYEDSPANTLPLPLTCCFPYPVMYLVRASKHWVVYGSATGFVHNVVPDPTSPSPATARCKYADTTCNPSLALRNSRARTVLKREVLSTFRQLPGYDDPRLFRNMQMQFMIWAPSDDEVSCSDAVCLQSQRDMNFRFTEIGGYKAFSNSLAASSSISPQSILFVPTLKKLAIPDGISSGLILFDLDRLAVSDDFM